MSWNNFINKITGKGNDAEVWRFRTSIMCNGCIAKITPVLDEAQGISSWKVDLTTPDRILSVVPNGISEEHLLELVRNAGFTIEKI